MKTDNYTISPPHFPQPLVNGKLVKVGDYANVFNHKLWKYDEGNNSQFIQRARILKVYWHNGIFGSSDWVVDVLFPDGLISKCHFLTGITPCD